MKKVLAITLIAMLSMGASLVSASANNAPEASVAFQAKKSKPAANKEVVFQTNIHCKNCCKKVEENIAFEKGVKALSVKLEDKTVKITYDPSKTDEAKLQAAIRKLGYTAEKKN